MSKQVTLGNCGYSWYLAIPTTTLPFTYVVVQGSNWNLYLASLKQIGPLFATLDHNMEDHSQPSG